MSTALQGPSCTTAICLEPLYFIMSVIPISELRYDALGTGYNKKLHLFMLPKYVFMQQSNSNWLFEAMVDYGVCILLTIF